MVRNDDTPQRRQDPEAEAMKIERNFTKAGQDAYAELGFNTTTSEIRNPDGTIVFKLDDCEIPSAWSQVASDVIAQKYFRKAGVPSETVKVEEKLYLLLLTL